MSLLRPKSAPWPILVAVLTVTVTLPVRAQDAHPEHDTLLTGAQWQAFNHNLVKAIQSESEGVREGALVQIAHYGNYMDFPELTVFEVMRIYRDHENPAIRRLAVVALGNMGSRWAVEFLDLLAPYEENESLRKTIKSVVRAGRAARAKS